MKLSSLLDAVVVGLVSSIGAFFGSMGYDYIMNRKPKDDIELPRVECYQLEQELLEKVEDPILPENLPMEVTIRYPKEKRQVTHSVRSGILRGTTITLDLYPFEQGQGLPTVHTTPVTPVQKRQSPSVPDVDKNFHSEEQTNVEEKDNSVQSVIQPVVQSVIQPVVMPTTEVQSVQMDRDEYRKQYHEFITAGTQAVTESQQTSQPNSILLLAQMKDQK